LVTGEGDRFVDALRTQAVDVTVHRAGPDLNPALASWLFTELRSFRPDVVHTHLIHADVHGQLAASALRVPGVSSVHDTARFYYREPFRSAGRLAGRLAARRIAISEHVARFLREMRLAPADRIRVVHYGIEPSAWSAHQGEATRARADLGISSNEIVVGIASRLVPGKGHEVLIEAFADAVHEVPELRLLIAGSGSEEQALRALAARRGPAGTVRFLGFVDDVRKFLIACDVLVFPTLPELSEGFGLAALEAMAAHLPVVASAVGSLSEVVDDGRTGLLVQPGSVEALRAAIVRLARDRALREQLGCGGANRARECFGLDEMVSRTISVYEEVT
jgi:glycosyltransferase involved in cell wall biosynthesis